MNEVLTKKAREVLQFLNDNPDETLLVAGGRVYYGHHKTSYKVLNQLIDNIFISKDQYLKNYYTINHSGKRYLKGLPPYRDSRGVYHETLGFLFESMQKLRQELWTEN